MVGDALPENRNKLENDTVGRHDEEEITISLLSQDHDDKDENAAIGHPNENDEVALFYSDSEMTVFPL